MAIHLTGLVTIALAFAAMFAQGPALAHGGGLDSEGGHTDRRTGEMRRRGWIARLTDCSDTETVVCVARQASWALISVGVDVPH